MVATKQKERETPRKKEISLTWKYVSIHFTIIAVENKKCDYRKK